MSPELINNIKEKSIKFNIENIDKSNIYSFGIIIL